MEGRTYRAIVTPSNSLAYDVETPHVGESYRSDSVMSSLTPSHEYALRTGEHTCESETHAHRIRRIAIDAGRSVSLIAFDASRGVYVWNVA